MTQTFVDYLNEIRPHDETIEAAMRSLVSEISGDKLPEDMIDEATKGAEDPDLLARLLVDLEHSPMQRIEVALAFLSSAWQDKSLQPKIRAAFAGAGQSLPIIEAALLAAVAAYSMYLAAVLHRIDVPVETRRTVRTNEKGFREETVTTVTQRIESPLRLFGRIFKGPLPPD